MKSKHTYSLPIPKDATFIASSDPRAHYGHNEHAVDFVIDFNVPILAPLDGEVWNVKDDATEGGNDDKYTDWEYQNIITIKHSENEYTQFGHLAHKSVKVKIGDKVKKGDVIATGIDMIGCTTTPHLHMVVFRVTGEGDDDWESLEITFDEPLRVIRNTKEYYEVLNRPENKRLKELEEKYWQ